MASVNLSGVIESLKKANVKFVRLTFCDSAGITRSKAGSLEFIESWATAGIGLCTAVQCLPVMYDVPAQGSGLTPIGELRLIPQLDTIQTIPYLPGMARVFVNMYDRSTNTVSPICPRGFLQRAIDLAAKEGFVINASFENEFCLLRPSDKEPGFVTADDTVYAAEYALDLHHDVMLDICDQLSKQGLSPELLHAEACPGQMEIPVKYSDAMKAADNQIIFKETVKAIAHKHGYIATFIPKVMEAQAGNGCHIHFSINDMSGKNLTPSETKPNEISDVMGHFIAGVLEHLPAMMSMTAPTTNSLRRVVPGAWCGAYRCWGYENREAAIRVPFGGSGQLNPSNIELKINDPSSNPYLALGSLIFAGMDGIKRKLRVPLNTDFDAGSASEELLKQRNIDILPRTVDAVIECLKKDQYMMDCLQEPLAKIILAVRQAEYQAMKDMTFNEEIKLLVNRY